MNDPNHTDPDRAMLDDLEAEYLAAVAAGDWPAYDYALAESSVFNASLNGNVMALLMTPAGANTGLAEMIRERLFEVLAEHVAPFWALAELPKRVAATEEMVAAWAEEAA
jgi:hypothetical protein